MWNKLINIDIYEELAKQNGWASKKLVEFLQLILGVNLS